MSYKCAWAALHALSLLPWGVLYLLADMVCPVVHHIARYRLRVVRDNLRSVFPDKSPQQLRAIESRFYHHLCDLCVEVVKQSSMSREEIMRRMQFTGLDHMRRQFADGAPFVFIMLGHYGNWEWISSLQYWLPETHCSQIYHRLYNATFDRIFIRLREQYGGECIEMKSTLRSLLTMRSQHPRIVTGFIADQQPKMNAIRHFAPFLGHDSAVFTGAEQLGRRLGAGFVYGHVEKVGRGRYVCHIEPLPLPPAEEGTFPLTEAYLQRLDQDIRAVPELWLWSHKRWSRTRQQWEASRQAHAQPHAPASSGSPDRE